MKHTRMGKHARRALSLLFALTLLWECGALTPKARAADVVAVDGTVNFVVWRRVYPFFLFQDLSKLCSDKPHPILLSYKSNKTEYFVCATKENWRWQDKDYNLVGMPKVSDPRFDDMRDGWKNNQDFFTTMGTYGSLWGQFKADGNAATLVLNVSNGNDGPGEYLGPGKSYSGQTYGGHKARDTCFVVRPQETAAWRVTAEGSYRMWNRDPDGSNEDVVFDGGTVKLSDDDRENFNHMWVGKVITASALTHDFTVLNDQATTMGRPVSYIPEGVTLRVASGGVLAVDGILLNDGKIVVEPGGLLVVRELSIITPFQKKNTRCGGISSAGTIVVQKDANIYGGGTNGVYLTGGVVYNFGGIASENFTATKKGLINNQKNAGLIAGRSMGSENIDEMLAYGVDYFTEGLNAVSLRTYSARRCTVCKLPFGRVNIADGAVYGDMKYYKNYGSFGDAGRMMKVFYHDGASAYEVLSAPSGTLGYRQSDTSHTVTRREVVYASGQIDTLRTQYEQMQNRKQPLPGKTNKEASLTVDTALTFEQYVEQYFRSQGLDLDEKVTVRDGVITVNGLSALTVPWNQLFSAAMKLNSGTMYFVKRQCPAELGDKAISLGGW